MCPEPLLGSEKKYYSVFDLLQGKTLILLISVQTIIDICDFKPAIRADLEVGPTRRK